MESSNRLRLLVEPLRRAHALSLPLLAYGLLGAVTGGLKLPSPGTFPIISSAGWKVALVLGTALLVLSRASLRSRRSARRFVLEAGVASLGGYLLLLLSDFPSRDESFLAGRPLLVFTGGLACALAVSFRKSRRVLFSPASLVALQILLSSIFLHFAAGRLIFSDDHPGFLYRLLLLAEHFPSVPFYNPAWNTGYSAREFFPSGAMNVFVFAWPLLRSIDPISLESCARYSLLVPYLFIGVLGWSLFGAARMLRLTRTEASAAAILSLAPSLLYFQHVLKYGTIGFALAAVLFPPAFAFLLTLIQSRRPLVRSRIILGGILCALALTWHLLALAFLPLIPFAALRLKAVWRRVLAVALIVLAINVHSLSTLATESRLLSLMSRNTLPGSTTTGSHLSAGERPSPRAWHQALKLLCRKSNPAIWLFSLPGLLLLGRKPVRWATGATLAWLVMLATVGDSFKPQLELHRFFLPALLLAAIPAARATVYLTSHFLRSGRVGRLAWTLRFGALIILLGGIMSTPGFAGAAYRNLSVERFRFASSELQEFAGALSRHGGSGRVFFLGFILHELESTSYEKQDGGHVAILAALSQKPMYASHYYHVYWSTVDPIPASYRKRGRAGIEEFLDLVHSTSVVTFKREWVRYCESDPRYREVHRYGRFRIFERRSEGMSYVLEGDADVETTRDGFTVTARSDRVVVKFRHLDRLRASRKDGSEVEISPVHAFDEDIGGGERRAVNYVALSPERRDIERRERIRVGF